MMVCISTHMSRYFFTINKSNLHRLSRDTLKDLEISLYYPLVIYKVVCSVGHDSDYQFFIRLSKINIFTYNWS